MAIKLKRFSRRKSTKFIAFVLIVAFITLGAVKLLGLDYQNLNIEALTVSDYSDSRKFLSEVLAYEDQVSYAFRSGTTSMDVDYYYYATDGSRVMQNAETSFMNQMKKVYDFEQWLKPEVTSKENTYEEHQEEVPTTLTIKLAFSDQYFEERQLEWEKEQQALVPYLVLVVVMILITLMLVIYLIMVTGREPEDDELHYYKVDEIHTDLQLLILFLSMMLSFSVGMDNISFYGPYGSNLTISQVVMMVLLGGMTAIVSSIYGVNLLSLIRKIKGHRFLKHTLIYSLWVKLNQFIKKFFDGSRFEHYPLTKSLHIRQITFIVSSFGLVMLTAVFFLEESFLVLFPPVVEIVIIYWYFTENKKTYEEINRGFHESLEEQMKSERMKIDLVTNVSHDLKTPLTSIISYVDLLMKEELPDTARDYVSILADKSNRLKSIVSDLFDLAKSTSGNIPMELESIDLKKLVEQTLADMEDKIEASGLQIKYKLLETPVYIYSDGKKLYRVFLNIIDNALKYSLVGTRIYIEMWETVDHVMVAVKNTAAYEMNFTPTEILQRFYRGDLSRSTQGSGLGLSIAESFTHVCGGSFRVEIDGDQFKVTVAFPISS